MLQLTKFRENIHPDWVNMMANSFRRGIPLGVIEGNFVFMWNSDFYYFHFQGG
jgi:hypothetical protein